MSAFARIAATLLATLFPPVKAPAADLENATGKPAVGQPEGASQWTVSVEDIVLERAGGVNRACEGASDEAEFAPLFYGRTRPPFRASQNSGLMRQEHKLKSSPINDLFVNCGHVRETHTPNAFRLIDSPDRTASMLRKMLPIVMCTLSLAACSGPNCADEIDAADNVVCNAAGLSSPTPDYVRCRQRLAQIRIEGVMTELSGPPYGGRYPIICPGIPLDQFLPPR